MLNFQKSSRPCLNFNELLRCWWAAGEKSHPYLPTITHLVRTAGQPPWTSRQERHFFSFHCKFHFWKLQSYLRYDFTVIHWILISEFVRAELICVIMIFFLFDMLNWQHIIDAAAPSLYWSALKRNLIQAFTHSWVAAAMKGAARPHFKISSNSRRTLVDLLSRIWTVDLQVMRQSALLTNKNK